MTSGLEFYSAPQHGEMGIEEWQALLSRFPLHAERAIASALRSEGYRLKNIIRQTVQLGGEPKWQELNPHTGILNKAKKGSVKNYRLSRKGVKKGEAANRIYRRHTESTRRNPLAKLAGATRYNYDDSIKTVTIGFLDQRMRGLAKKHAQGFRTSITPRMRRMAFSLGFPLKADTSEFVVPARPLVEPVFRKEEKQIKISVQLKTVGNIVRYLQGSYGKMEAA